MSELTAAEWMCKFMCPEPEFDCEEGTWDDEEEWEDPEQAEADYYADQGYDDEFDRELGLI